MFGKEKVNQSDFDYLESQFKETRSLVWDQQRIIAKHDDRIDQLTAELVMLKDSHYELHHRFDVLLEKLGYTIIKRPKISIIVSTKKLKKVGDMTKLKEWN